MTACPTSPFYDQYPVRLYDDLDCGCCPGDCDDPYNCECCRGECDCECHDEIKGLDEWLGDEQNEN